MRTDLKDYVEKLRLTTAEKERIESEINIARSIQMSLLPKEVPQSAAFDLCAMLEPARQVGGDFYDCFMIDDDDICLVIADVSGKGVPAALFMAVTRTYLKALAWEAHSPAETLFRLNNELAHGNEGSMFVTLFYAVIRLSTGECRYASAGHNPPFVVHNDGSITPVPRLKGAVLGAMKDLPYEEGTFVMHSGEMIYLYTDGVTEAMNPADELYGEKMVLEELMNSKDKTCPEILGALRASVNRFADGAAQSDDITQLAFRYTGGIGRIL
jgi:sigma-B regulation protein RsbU (phosphoserine phosphatase)